MTQVSVPVNAGLDALFAVLGLLEARRLWRKHPDIRPENIHQKARYLPWSTVAMLAVVVPLLVTDIVLRWHVRLPLRLQLHHSAILWALILSDLAFLFAVSIGVAYAAGHRERHKLALVGPLLVLALFYPQWRYYTPIADDLMGMVDEHGIVHQSSDWSCAAASGANVARRLGHEMTERRMAEIMGTTRIGTTPAQIVVGLEAIGVRCRLVREPDGAPPAFEPPAILFVDHPEAGSEGHAVAYMGRSEGRYEIWDPLAGRTWLEAPELLEIWHGHGVACLGEP